MRGVSVRTWPAVPGSVERGWVGRSMSDHWLACGDRLWIVGSVGGPGANKGSYPVGNTMDNACYAEFTYGSCIRRCGAVVDIGCILHWQASTWGWSVVAGGSGGGASVPGGWRSEKPTTWTHAARPSCYLRLSTGLQWRGERGQTEPLGMWFSHRP